MSYCPREQRCSRLLPASTGKDVLGSQQCPNVHPSHLSHFLGLQPLCKAHSQPLQISMFPHYFQRTTHLPSAVHHPTPKSTASAACAGTLLVQPVCLLPWDCRSLLEGEAPSCPRICSTGWPPAALWTEGGGQVARWQDPGCMSVINLYRQISSMLPTT